MNLFRNKTTMTYRVVRFYAEDDKRDMLEGGLTKEQAASLCDDEDACSTTATSEWKKELTKNHGPWFEGYVKEQ